jgi:G3E family GTPase
MASPARRPGEPIPLTVLTGFLGAGKTSLLQRLLADPALAHTAVLINELGEIGLDHLFVRHVSDNVMLLASCCLCCSLRGDLVDALENLLRDLDNGRADFRRVIIETTGLADPAPVLHTVMAHPYLVMRYRLDGIVTVVDALNGAATFDRHAEAIKQAAIADRIALSKTDLLDHDDSAIRDRLRKLNPAAPILDVAAGEATPAALLDSGLSAARDSADIRRWLGATDDHDHAHHDHLHDDRIRSFALTTEAAVPAAALDMFLDMVRSLHGPQLLRLKGIIRLAETPEKPVVIHGVQHVLHPVANLPAWPDEDRRTRLVFIMQDTDPQAIRALFDAFFGDIAPDRPDRAAVVDNPLVPFGGAGR